MKITQKGYFDAQENCAGYCPACDDIVEESGVEPDAAGYNCPWCRGKTMMGIENALLSGHLEFVDC